MIPQGAKLCVFKFMPDTDSHLNQWRENKACTKDFAVNKDLKESLLIAQGIIIYLMEANFSSTCTQVKCFDFAKCLW